MHKKEYETMRNFMSACLMAAAMLGTAGAASVAMAATIAPGNTAIQSDDAYDYQGVFVEGSGPTTLTFDLTALDALVLDGEAITLEFTGTFENLAVSLDSVAATLTQSGPNFRFYTFSTVAFALGEMKSLVLSWTDVAPARGTSAQINLQLSTAAVPLPAGGLLLLTALGGVAALRRRKALAA